MGRSSVSIRINYAKLRRVAEDYADESSKSAADVTADRIRGTITKQDRILTGKMLQSVQVEKTYGPNYRVICRTPYVGLQNDGRGPVRVVRAKWLRWIPKGTNKYKYSKKTGPDPGGHFFEEARDRLHKNDWLS